MSDGEKPKKHSLSWVLWWQTDPVEIDKQVAEYKSLSLFKSARGVSVLCLLLSMAITSAFVFFGSFDLTSFVDVAAFGILALFIYLGHRWAIIGAMLLWTVEKVVTGISGVGGVHPNSTLLIGQFFWWTAYMHAFYVAFKVEQKRMALVRLTASASSLEKI